MYHAPLMDVLQFGLQGNEIGFVRFTCSKNTIKKVWPVKTSTKTGILNRLDRYQKSVKLKTESTQGPGKNFFHFQRIKFVSLMVVQKKQLPLNTLQEGLDQNF